jgi:hypothetical protein
MTSFNQHLRGSWCLSAGYLAATLISCCAGGCGGATRSRFYDDLDYALVGDASSDGMTGVTVFYATDRTMAGGGSSDSFGADPDGTIHLGSVDVRIANKRPVGGENPFFLMAQGERAKSDVQVGDKPNITPDVASFAAALADGGPCVLNTCRRRKVDHWNGKTRVLGCIGQAHVRDSAGTTFCRADRG